MLEGCRGSMTPSQTPIRQKHCLSWSGNHEPPQDISTSSRWSSSPLLDSQDALKQGEGRTMLCRVEGSLQFRHNSCFHNGYSRFTAFLVFGFVFLSQDLTDPRLNLSSLSGQRWPWTSHPPAFSLWVLNIVWYSWGNFFSSDIGEGKIHRIYNYHQKNNAKWWLPSKQCSLQLTSKAMQWARTQTVSDYYMTTEHSTGSWAKGYWGRVSQPGSKCWNKMDTNKWKVEQPRPKVCLTAVSRRMYHAHVLILSLPLCSHALWRDSLPVWAYFDICQINELK